MKTRAFTRKIKTETAPQFIDITDWAQGCVARAGVTNGFALVYSPHTTAAVTINENEPLLIEDLTRFLERLCPRQAEYRHNDFAVRTVNMTEQESPNAHAHLLRLMMGGSETIPLVNGAMILGRWQSIFFVELDHPRSREVMVQIVGE